MKINYVREIRNEGWMKVLKNYLYNLVYQIFVLIVPLATIPYISRVLGPKGVGINTLTTSVIQYFILLATLGLATYGQREIAYRRDSRRMMSRTFWEIESLSVITTCLTLILYLLFLVFSTKYTVYYFCQSFLIIACAFDISWFFMGLELFKLTVLRNFIVKLISVVLIFTLVKNKDDLYVYILIISVSTLFGNLSLWPYLRSYVGRFSFRYLNVKRHLKPIIALFIPQIAINVYVFLNKIMLANMVSVEASGFFDSSDKIIRMSLTIISALTTVMFPRVAGAFAKGRNREVSQYLEKSFQISMAIAVPLMIGIMTVSTKFVPWFFGVKFKSVTSIMMIEAIAIIPIACSQLIGMQYLIPTKQTKIYTQAISIGAVLNFLINIPLIYYFSGVGTAITTVISETFIAGFEFYFVSKQIKIYKLFKGLYKIILSSCFMFLVVKVSIQYFTMSIVTLGSIIIIGVLSYVLALYIFKLDILIENIKKISK